VAVVDACVFPHRKLLSPILDAAGAGYVIPIWSPAIITEVNCLLARLWLKRHGGGWTGELERQHSREMHTWFRHMTAAFRVVDDRPPPAPLWTAQPRDEHDVPIWTAAVRAHANFVVTENLVDGPPPDAAGVRHYGGITYVHPTDFLSLLELWGSLIEMRQPPIVAVMVALLEGLDAPVQLSPQLEAYLGELESRFSTREPGS
jgi:PIN domain